MAYLARPPAVRDNSIETADRPPTCPQTGHFVKYDIALFPTDNRVSPTHRDGKEMMAQFAVRKAADRNIDSLHQSPS
jgi:hypothetical protein